MTELPGSDDDQERAWRSSREYRAWLQRMGRDCREDELTADELADLHRIQRDEERGDYERSRL